MRNRPLLLPMVALILLFSPLSLSAENDTVEDAQFWLAQELFQKQKYTEAIREFRRLLLEMKTDEYSDACYYYLGGCYFQLKRFEEAEESYGYLVDNFKSSRYRHAALYLLGRLCFLQGNFRGAIKRFDSYLRQYPNLEYADNSLYWKAEALIKMGEREAGITTLERLLVDYPGGNKAEAARCRLGILALEDRYAEQEKKGESTIRNEQPLEGAETQQGELAGEVQRLKKREAELLREIAALNSRLDLLNAEMEEAKEFGSAGRQEEESRLAQRMKALASWENVLRIKERALELKEKALKEGFERLEQRESADE
jgi:TolA-binding protein